MKRTVLICMLVLVGLVARVGSAAAGKATDFVKAKQGVLAGLLSNDASGNQKKIAAIFDEILDDAGMAQAALGSEWAARTAAEQAQFTDLCKQLVRKAYERNLRKTLGYRIEYVGETTSAGAPVTAAVTIVRTRAVSPDAREDPIAIDVKVAGVRGKLRIQDLVTDEVSLVAVYRSQFVKIIKKDGFPALIQKMKDKLARGD